MKTLLLSTAIILGVAVQAQANDQLAHSVGVEPGQYTTAQLVQLMTAQTDDNTALFNHLLDEFDSNVISTQSGGISAGHRQLAASLGVDPTDFSVAELVQLRVAREDGDAIAERAIMANGGDVISTQSGGITGGQRQLAASLGVDPADYTVNELAGMYIDAHD